MNVHWRRFSKDLTHKTWNRKLLITFEREDFSSDNLGSLWSARRDASNDVLKVEGRLWTSSSKFCWRLCGDRTHRNYKNKRWRNLKGELALIIYKENLHYLTIGWACAHELKLIIRSSSWRVEWCINPRGHSEWVGIRSHKFLMKCSKYVFANYLKDHSSKGAQEWSRCDQQEQAISTVS